MNASTVLARTQPRLAGFGSIARHEDPQTPAPGDADFVRETRQIHAAPMAVAVAVDLMPFDVGAKGIAIGVVQ